ncbi:MAG: metallophosphoesterase [Lentisphaeria bacterium]|nr:metallophosphoesterase [Lentisphaeria bacterium]
MKIKTILFTAILILLSGCAICGKTSPDAHSTAAKSDGRDNYQVTFIGDMHYDGPQYHIEPKTPAGARLHYGQWQSGVSQQLLAEAAKQSKDASFVVQLGDMINGDCDNAEKQSEALRDAYLMLKKFFPGKKVFFVEGNHDHRGKLDAAQAPDRVMLPLMIKELGDDAQMDGLNYSIRHGKDLFIFYDYRKETSGNFVKKAISSNGDARHIFFLTHLPMYPCSIGNPGWVVPHFRELIPLLAEKKAIVINAHTHSMNYIVYKCDAGVLPQLTVTSMGREWFPGTPLNVRCNSFAEWKKGVKPLYFTNPKYKKSIEKLNFFKNADFVTYRVGQLAPSGFVKLEIKGSQVSAHIFTDNSGKPAETIILK